MVLSLKICLISCTSHFNSSSDLVHWPLIASLLAPFHAEAKTVVLVYVMMMDLRDIKQFIHCYWYQQQRYKRSIANDGVRECGGGHDQKTNYFVINKFEKFVWPKKLDWFNSLCFVSAIAKYTWSRTAPHHIAVHHTLCNNENDFFPFAKRAITRKEMCVQHKHE